MQSETPDTNDHIFQTAINSRQDAPGREIGSWWLSTPRDGFTERAKALQAEMSRTPEGRMVGMGATVGWGPRIGPTR